MGSPDHSSIHGMLQTNRNHSTPQRSCGLITQGARFVIGALVNGFNVKADQYMVLYVDTSPM